MRCIVLHQPWASLCATIDPLENISHTAGPKRMVKAHETRSWAAPASVIGQRVAIAAAITSDGWKSIRHTRVHDLYYSLGIQEGKPSDPRGAILCTAVIIECRPTDSHHLWHDSKRPTLSDLLAGDWTPGRYAWRLGAVEVCKRPIPITGAQGLFRLPPEAFDRLTIQGCTPGARVED